MLLGGRLGGWGMGRGGEERRGEGSALRCSWGLVRLMRILTVDDERGWMI